MKSQKGFTIIELLTILIFIAVLFVGIYVPVKIYKHFTHVETVAEYCKKKCSYTRAIENY